MARLRPMLQNEIIRILENNGFRLVRTASHMTFKKTKADGQVLTTWVPLHREVTVFVIQHIIRQAEKSRSEFE